jgi:uncharacterized integral membrane protein
MLIFTIIALLIAILAVVFALQNTAVVTVTFLVWNFQSSLALVLLLALVAGLLICFLAMAPGMIRSGWRASRQRKLLDRLENDLAEHRRKLDEPRKPEAEEPESAEPVRD